MKQCAVYLSIFFKHMSLFIVWWILHHTCVLFYRSLDRWRYFYHDAITAIQHMSAEAIDCYEFIACYLCSDRFAVVGYQFTRTIYFHTLIAVIGGFVWVICCNSQLWGNVDYGHRQKPIDCKWCHFQNGRQVAILYFFGFWTLNFSLALNINSKLH